jgi:hypothetical protein
VSALHAFHLVTTGMMLFWYVRFTVFRHGRQSRPQTRPAPAPALR